VQATTNLIQIEVVALEEGGFLFLEKPRCPFINQVVSSPYPRAPTHLSTFEVLSTNEHTQIPFPYVVFTFGLVVEFI